MLQKYLVAWNHFAKELKKENISAHAASTAFFLFLSLVPMLIVLCSIIPYTPLTQADLAAFLTDLTPDVVDPVVVRLVAEVYIRTKAVLPIALVITIWSAAKGVMALMNGLNVINDVDEERNYFVVRGVASFYTVIMLLILLLSLFFMVFGNQLIMLIMNKLPALYELVRLLLNLRFIFVWLFLTVIFGMIYTYIPNKKLLFKEQVFGAMFSAIIWILFSWGFSMYVDFGYSSNIYGSLTIIVIVMLWMYFCMYIILIGAYLNRYFKTT